MQLRGVDAPSARRGTARAFDTNAPVISPYRATSKAWAKQLGGDDPADHAQDHEGIAVEGEPRRPGDEPTKVRPADRDEDDDGDHVLHRADRRPQRAVERDRAGRSG